MTAKKLAKFDPKAVLDSILNLDFSGCDVTVCLASVDKDTELIKFERLQLSGDLTDDFRNVVSAVIEKWKKSSEDGDLILQVYEAGSKPDSHEVEYVDLSEHDFIKQQIASLSSLADVAIFSNDSDFMSGLRFYVIIIQPKHGEPIYCFRLYSQKKELHRSVVFAALFTDGHFDRVREPMFLFDQHIDCISRSNTLFIFTKDRFQKIFRFFEMVKETAKETLKIIKARIPILNFEEFEKVCEGHLQKLAKLKNIASNPYLEKITIKDIKKVIRHYNLPIQITQKGRKEMLVFDPSNKWEILRLLDDDYLKSLMTGQRYEVTGKRLHQ